MITFPPIHTRIAALALAGAYFALTPTPIMAAVSDPGVLNLVLTNVVVPEGGSRAMLHVLRTDGRRGTVSVDYATSDETARASLDYSPVGGTLYLSNGVVRATIPVPILNDALAEGSETFSVTLSNVTGGATLGSRSRAHVRILDNDRAGRIAFSSRAYAVSESNGLAQIVVNRFGGSAGGVTAQFSTVAESATEGEDYVGTNIVVTFGSNEMRQTFSVVIRDDLLAEGRETLRLQLRDPAGGASLTVQSNATLTIVDNEFPVAGYYRLSGNATAGRCRDTEDNSSTAFRGWWLLTNQVGNEFTGTGNWIALGGVGLHFQSLTGRVDSAGTVTGRYTWFDGIDTTGTGTFSGRVIGHHLTARFRATENGDTCEITGNFTGDSGPADTNGPALPTLVGRSLLATIASGRGSLAATGQVRFIFSATNDTFQRVRVSGASRSGTGNYVYAKTGQRVGMLALADADNEFNQSATLSFITPTNGVYTSRAVPPGSQIGQFIVEPGSAQPDP